MDLSVTRASNACKAPTSSSPAGRVRPIPGQAPSYTPRLPGSWRPSSDAVLGIGHRWIRERATGLQRYDVMWCRDLTTCHISHRQGRRRCGRTLAASLVGLRARDNAQTVELTLERWPDATTIGGQSPKSRVKKAQVIVERIRALRRWAQSFGAEVALSHNSYGRIVAARTLGLRVVTAMDYEGQPSNHLAFRLAHVILMPDALRGSGLRKQGATDRRTRLYPGFREEIYLGDFEPDPEVLASIGVERSDRPLVVARTSTSRAAYHQFGDPLFGEAIEALGNDGSACVVVLVRHPEQRHAIQALGLTNLVVPDRLIDSRSLMYQDDLVIGAGGTMTLEAALMGALTYSAFAGEQPAVDPELKRSRLLQRLRSGVASCPIATRRATPRPLHAVGIRADIITAFFVNATVSVAHSHAHHSRLTAHHNVD